MDDFVLLWGLADVTYGGKGESGLLRGGYVTYCSLYSVGQGRWLPLDNTCARVRAMTHINTYSAVILDES